MLQSIRNGAFGLLLTPLLSNAVDTSPLPELRVKAGGPQARLICDTNISSRFAKPGSTNPPSGQLTVTNRISPAPRVYLSKPYTCIVVVPGPHADEAMIKPAPPVEPRMPTIVPDLKLVPKQ